MFREQTSEGRKQYLKTGKKLMRSIFKIDNRTIKELDEKENRIIAELEMKKKNPSL